MRWVFYMTNKKPVSLQYAKNENVGLLSTTFSKAHSHP